MKYFILFLSSIFFSSIFISVSAQELKPSLLVQMQKQEKINKKNFVTARRNALLAKRQQRNIVSVSAKPTIIKTPLAFASAALVPKPIIPLQITSSVAENSDVLLNASIKNVDMTLVRSSWLWWYNATRESLWLSAYEYDSRLDITASDWNQVFAKAKWLNHHTRNPGDKYYDFPVIDRWFIDRWVNPPIVNRAKHTENVWYGYYFCNKSDCTESLISSIRSTYDFFMREKGKAYDAHYRSIVQPNFTKIGLSILVVSNEQRYYLTVHYITE